jgi:hypothetical protein
MGGMKFWLYLVAKLAIAGGVVFLLESALNVFYPVPTLRADYGPPQPLFLHDMLFTFLTLGIWLVGAGLLSLVLWD